MSTTSPSPLVLQVLQSRYLSAHIKSRLATLKTNLSEEDVLHYVILSLIETIKSGKEVRNPVSWGKTVAERYISKQYKLCRQSIAVESGTLEFLENLHRPEVSSLDTDDTEYLNSLIERLKHPERQLIRWRFFDNLSWAQIAVRLSTPTKSVSEQTARKRGERALDALRSLYTDNSSNR